MGVRLAGENLLSTRLAQEQRAAEVEGTGSAVVATATEADNDGNVVNIANCGRGNPLSRLFYFLWIFAKYYRSLEKLANFSPNFKLSSSKHDNY